MNPDLTQTLPLHDIHLPTAISWWPLAPGWWYLLALLLSLAALVFAIVHWYEKGALKREAKARLNQIAKRYNSDNDAVELAQELSILLRRIALSSQDREMVAGLTGEAWLEFLDGCNNSGANKMSGSFQQGAGRILLDAPYRQQVDKQEAEKLLDLCGNWINNSRL